MNLLKAHLHGIDSAPLRIHGFISSAVCFPLALFVCVLHCIALTLLGAYFICLLAKLTFACLVIVLTPLDMYVYYIGCRAVMFTRLARLLFLAFYGSARMFVAFVCLLYCLLSFYLFYFVCVPSCLCM